LRSKESLPADKEILIIGGEENLLAKYLENGRSFSWMDEADMVMIDETVWPKFSSLPQVKEKKKLDRISYGWDATINRAHDGTSNRYERVARELARLDRFKRRVLSQSFFEAYSEYRSNGIPIFRRCTVLEDTTYCFLFMEDGRNDRPIRKAMLGNMCFIARGLHPQNSKVLGIATEAENRSYDFCLLVKPEWTSEDKQMSLEMQAKTGIFVNPRQTTDQVDEYPEIPQTE
jgi:hypothetical protein